MLFVKAAPILLLAAGALAAPAREVVVTKQDVTVVTKVVHVAAGSEPTGGFGGHRGGPPDGMSFPNGGPSQSGGRPGRPQATPTPVPDTPTGAGNGEGSGDDDDDTSAAPTSTGRKQGGKPTASSPAGGKPAATSAVSGPTPTGSTGGGASGGDADTTEVNKYRGMMNKGLKDLTYDTKLESNIKDCLSSSPGVMTHKLNPGSMGQVLAQGDCSDFTSALVHGWICERPSLLPSGMCTGGGYNTGGQTGHADILSDAKYKKIACACQQGIWGCDFA